MQVLIAPDKFKGSLSAAEVATELARGLAEQGVSSVELPLADGGDGSVEAALAAGFESVSVSARNALGERRQTTIAFDGFTAVVEVANTCGLHTLPAGPLDPTGASSAGFGDAVAAALGLGARRVVLALGGSASTDGGLGLLAALGARATADSGEIVEPSGGTLSAIVAVDVADLPDLSDVEMVVASDVQNPLIGVDGSAAVYGPQKGATPELVTSLDAGLRHLVQVLVRSGFPDAPRVANAPGAGAAGGIGFAAMLLGGRVVSGADFFLDLLQFDARLASCDVVITGEGRIDDQTVHGKLPAVVARRAGGRAVIAVVGRDDLSLAGRQALGLAGIYAVAEQTDRDPARDPELTAAILRQLGRTITLPGQDRFALSR